MYQIGLTSIPIADLLAYAYILRTESLIDRYQGEYHYIYSPDHMKKLRADKIRAAQTVT
ncbi:MAG: hypothetical protein RIG62_18200 [Cyclobacteriaceae bacterium]